MSDSKILTDRDPQRGEHVAYHCILSKPVFDLYSRDTLMYAKEVVSGEETKEKHEDNTAFLD